MDEQNRKTVCIVVLGDLGRSPRMQYHALSFLEEGYNVQFVGYCETDPVQKIIENDNVSFQCVTECPDFKAYLPSALAYIAKVFWQTITLLFALLMIKSPDFVLVQNPPAMPTLGVCYLYCRLFGCKFVIDWHNYAHSLLALAVGTNHLLVRILKYFEFFFGRRADGNICVTKAMKHDLLENHGVVATTFYDRPAEFFKPTTLEEKHSLFLALGLEYDIFLRNCKFGDTVFTKIVKDYKVALKDDRPGLLVSSTSWTQDEDFSILLSALEEYEKAKASSDTLPKLICVITGKGPLKEFYMNIIEKKKWKHVQVITPWLDSDDYPLFLGSADLGVSLHTSSSGLDLPMKVVDMFGSSLPVCAVNYNCLKELVKHGENGFVFNDEKELFLLLKQWFDGFPKSKNPRRETIKSNLIQFNRLKWHDNWKFKVQPMF